MVPSARAPYGSFAAAPIILSVIALIFTSVTWLHCTTFAWTVTFSGLDPQHGHSGFTSVQTEEGDCYALDAYSLDGPLKAGYALGIVATVFGVLQAIAVICTTFVVFPKVFQGFIGSWLCRGCVFGCCCEHWVCTADLQQ